MTYAAEIKRILSDMGVPAAAFSGGSIAARSPITGEILAQVPAAGSAQTSASIGAAHAAFNIWRNLPAPQRGELVRLWAEELRKWLVRRRRASA